MKKRTLLILLCLAAATGASGQYLRLAGDTMHTALYLDAGRIWNYNLYEHSRWGGGLMLTVHPEHFIFNRVDAEGYLGYGALDRQWKGGLALAEHVRNSTLGSVHYQRAEWDYFPIGSRHIGNPWSGGQLLGGFMARRMTGERRVTLGHRWNTDGWRWAVEFTAGMRGKLFDENNLLYLNQDTINFERVGVLRLLLRHRCGFAAQYELFGDLKTMRLLVDYRRSIPLSFLKLDLYTQGGVSPRHNEYIDMFDLGGIYNAPLYLERGFSTIRPNEFTANSFALLCLRLQSRKPLYSSYSILFRTGSNPSPFVGLNALWGNMWGQDALGQRPWLDSYLQAPHRGLLEVSLGMDGIVRWGVVDWGIAIARRITPASTPYHLPSPRSNVTLLITAKMTE